MLKKLGSCVLVCIAVLAGTSSAYAQRTAPAFSSADEAKHTVNFTFGLFTPFKDDARVEGDVLNANSTFLEMPPVGSGFDIDEFRSGTFGVEWLIPIGSFVEAGAGLSYQKKTVDTIYADFFDSDGSEIDQELSLRQVPLSFTVRGGLFGDSPVQPYGGLGFNITRWKYSEIGEFIGENDLIFDGEFEADGWSTAPVFLVGVKFAGDAFAVGIEFRRVWNAEGDLPTEFFGSKIDLGGSIVQGTLGVRF